MKWVEFEVLLATRKYLIKNRMRGEFSGEEERRISHNLYKKIVSDKDVWKSYVWDAKRYLKNPLIFSNVSSFRNYIVEVRDMIQELTTEECREVAKELIE